MREKKKKKKKDNENKVTAIRAGQYYGDGNVVIKHFILCLPPSSHTHTRTTLHSGSLQQFGLMILSNLGSERNDS